MQTIRKLGRLSGFFCLAIGLSMMAVTIWAFYQAIFTFNGYLFLRLVLSFDCFIVFASLVGICGIKKNIGTFVCIFQLFVLAFFLIFIIIGVTAQVIPGITFSGNCTTSDNPLIGIAHETSLMGKGLCTADCPCGLTDNAINNGNYTLSQKSTMATIFKRTPSGPVRYQDCNVSKNADIQYQGMYLVLQTMQTAFGCSGWCKDEESLIFTFSDVNSGKPQTTCYDFMKDQLNTYGHALGICAFIGACLMFLVLICGLCYCCTRRNKPSINQFTPSANNGIYRPL